MKEVVEKLRPYLLGWKAYFEMAQTPGVWRELDEWVRHRLRAIQLKHWKRPKSDLQGTQSAGSEGKCGATSGGKLLPLVAQQ